MATQLSLGLAVQGTHFSTMAAGRDPMALWDTDFWERGEDSPSELPFCPCTVQWAMGGGWSSLPSMSPKDRGTKSAELPARAPLGGWGELAAQVAAAPKENGVSHCPEGKELLLPPAVFWCVSHPQGMEPRSSPRLEVCEMGFVAEFHSSGSCGGGQGSSSRTLPRAVVRCFSSPGNPRSPWGCAGI